MASVDESEELDCNGGSRPAKWLHLYYDCRGMRTTPTFRNAVPGEFATTEHFDE